MSKTKITLNNVETEVEAGFTLVGDFYEKLGIQPSSKRLYLERAGDVNVPLLSDDHIVIHGGEQIVVGDFDDQAGDNPSVSSPINITLNGEKVGEGLNKARVRADEICRMDKELESARLFLDVSGDVDIPIKNDLNLVLQVEDSFFTIPSGKSDSIDLEACAKNERKPPKGQDSYLLTIDGNQHEVKRQKLTGKEILELVGKSYDTSSLNKKLHGGRRKPIGAEEMVDLAEPGVERFETVMLQARQG